MNNVLLPKMTEITDDDWEHYLEFSPNDYIKIIKESLISQNRFFADNRFNKLIYWHAFDSQSRFNAQKVIYPETQLFRARVYREDDLLRRINYPLDNAPFFGYGKDDSFVPKKADSVKDGRANPANIPYLYAASDIDTSINEVNAQQGEWVSVAQIKVIERLHLYYLASSTSAIDANTLKKSKWVNSFVLYLSRIFQAPATMKYDYLLCQYVSEFIKNWGFDGIAFYSSKTQKDINKGINYTIFNYEKCEAISSQLFFVEEVKRKYHSYGAV